MTVTQDGDNDDDDDDDETDCKEERDDVDSGGRTVALTHARRWTTPHNYTSSHKVAPTTNDVFLRVTANSDFTFEFDLHNVRVNEHTKGSKVIQFKSLLSWRAHTHIRPTALPGPLKFSVNIEGSWPPTTNYRLQ